MRVVLTIAVVVLALAGTAAEAQAGHLFDDPGAGNASGSYLLTGGQSLTFTPATLIGGVANPTLDFQLILYMVDLGGVNADRWSPGDALNVSLGGVTESYTHGMAGDHPNDNFATPGGVIDWHPVGDATSVAWRNAMGSSAPLTIQMVAGSVRIHGLVAQSWLDSGPNYAYTGARVDLGAVPEPGTLALSLFALGGAFVLRRRTRSA